MTNEITLKLDLPDFGKAAARIEREFPYFLAAQMQVQRAMIFRSEGSYNGRPGWAPLKSRKGRILKDRGTLSQSIGPRTDGIRPGAAVGSIVRAELGVITIGTNIAYAAVHDRGATIAAHEQTLYRNKRRGRFRKHSKEGGIWSTAHVASYQIPQREFSNFTSADVSELRVAAENFISELIRGANT